MLIDRSAEAIKLKDQALERAMVEIGATAEGYAKKGCPVNTGRLRNSITWVTHENNGDLRLFGDLKTAVHKAGDSTPHGHAPKGSVAIGTNVEYASKQEFGEGLKHRVGGAHFLRNAISNYIAKYYKIVEKHLRGN